MRLLVSAIGGEGHLRPLLPVATAAAAAGHDVLVAAAPVLAPVAAGAGLAFAPVPPDVEPQHLPLRPVDLEHELRVVRESFAGWMARERAAALRPLVADWRPDLVLRDELDFGAAAAAGEVPVATVLVVAADGFAGPLPDGLVLSPFPPSLRAGGRAFRGLPTGRAEGRTVYVTLGTVFNTECGDLFARLVEGVRTLPVDVVVTVGAAVDPAALGPQPPNVRVARYVPQAEVLPRCAAVVCHAGSGSLTGALAYGVPLVCVPLGADQPLNAARCAALGVGVALDAVALTPDDVRTAVTAVLDDPAYAAAAAAVRDEYAALPPAGAAVGWLEEAACG